MPRFRRVVRPSGHKTLRIIFSDDTQEPAREDILAKLNEMAANYEGASGSLYAIDVRPEANYQSICDFLWDLEQNGTLQYETGAMSEDTL